MSDRRSNAAFVSDDTARELRYARFLLAKRLARSRIAGTRLAQSTAEYKHDTMKADHAKKAKPSRRRASVTPASTESSAATADQISRRAYELYQQRGAAHGHDWEDWLSAERELGSAD